jgi:hypothetical protein
MPKSTGHGGDGSNVNVTLGQSVSLLNPLTGQRFPCPICGNALEIRFTCKNKPYTTCLGCGIQTFFRGKPGIKRLTELVKSGILISGNGSQSELAVLLFNRIQQLREQKRILADKQGLIFVDPDLQNAIRVVNNEISRVQNELAKEAGQVSPMEGKSK